MTKQQIQAVSVLFDNETKTTKDAVLNALAKLRDDIKLMGLACIDIDEAQGTFYAENARLFITRLADERCAQISKYIENAFEGKPMLFGKSE